MAGIGFRLQKLLSGESYTDLIKAYLFSAVIMTGPFLAVLVALSAVSLIVRTQFSFADINLFQGLVVYALAFSLVGVAPALYVVTRYLADQYFLNRPEAFTPTYLSALEFGFIFQGTIALIFLFCLDLPSDIRWSTFCLYLFLNGIWLGMVFLSAARSYLWIVAAFAVGSAVSVLAAYFLSQKGGVAGALKGYTLGQGIIFVLLTVRIFLEFGYTRSRNIEFLQYFKRYPYLLLVGICYYVGIWIDKFIFWASDFGRVITPGIRMAPDYDTPMFVAYLTIIPSMAFFLIQMETSFARHYQAYYQSVRNRAELPVIEKNRQAIVGNLTQNLQRYVVFQGIISGLIILFIDDLALVFGLGGYQLGILRIGILGVFLQMGFMMLMNIMFYFDFRKEVFYLTFVFLVTNALFTYLSLRIGLAAYGFGFTLSCLVSAVFATLLLDRKLKSLNYWTFMTQPILLPKFKYESETQARKIELT